MTKKIALLAAPASVHVSTTRSAVLRNIRVLDAGTAEPIAKVISADVDAGKVSRFDVDEHGNMVREDNAFRIVDEDRAIRIEWIDPPAAEPADDEAAEG